MAERVKNQWCEEHGFTAKAIRRITVPLFNVLPERFVRRLLAISPDGELIMNHCGSTHALEVMYAWHERDPFSPGVLPGLGNLFWFHCISQPKAMRNRLRIVQKILREEIARRLCASVDRISILSLGGGSCRALIQAVAELIPLAVQHAVRVINVDKDETAAALGRQIAAKYDVAEAFRWVVGNSKDLGSLADDDSVAIVEMVGLFDCGFRKFCPVSFQ